jgi:hypothetical protein
MSVPRNGKFYSDEEWEAMATERDGPRGDPIPVDEQAILALTRVTTGADVHDSNALIGTYKNYCQSGRQKGADRVKQRMYERAIMLGKRRELGTYL